MELGLLLKEGCAAAGVDIDAERAVKLLRLAAKSEVDEDRELAERELAELGVAV